MLDWVVIGITNSYSVAIVFFCLKFLLPHHSPHSEERRVSIQKQLSYLTQYFAYQEIQFSLPFNHSAVKPAASLRRNNLLRSVLILLLSPLFHFPSLYFPNLMTDETCVSQRNDPCEGNPQLGIVQLRSLLDL